MEATDTTVECGSGHVFADLGFPAADRPFALAGCEVFAKLVDSGYRGIPPNSRSAAVETRSSRGS